jgi:hypothetical protein
MGWGLNLSSAGGGLLSSCRICMQALKTRNKMRATSSPFIIVPEWTQS